MDLLSAQTWQEAWTRPERFNAWPETEVVRWASTLESGAKVLDVGCGRGASLRALQSFDLDAWGVDIAAEAVRASAPFAAPFQLKVASATDLPFEDGTFDALCDVQCFQHLAADELPRAYKEAARVLKPGGRFFEMFLIGGQEHFDLPFGDFDAVALITAGLRITDLGASTRYHHHRSYAYIVLEAERV